MTKSKAAENDTLCRVLTADEKAHLHLWASATPAQRLAWLEEALHLAAKSGALTSGSKGY